MEASTSYVAIQPSQITPNHRDLRRGDILPPVVLSYRTFGYPSQRDGYSSCRLRGKLDFFEVRSAKSRPLPPHMLQYPQ
jgi:hypothetical protein